MKGLCSAQYNKVTFCFIFKHSDICATVVSLKLYYDSTMIFWSDMARNLSILMLDFKKHVIILIA
jgi:hypothetical protein